MYVVDKQYEVTGALQLQTDSDVNVLVRDNVISKYLTSLKGVHSFSIRQDSPANELRQFLTARGSDLCEAAKKIVEQYHATQRSRSALIIVTKFAYKGREFIGFFQLHELAVMALYPERQQLKVIQRAFRRYEKAFVTPSPAGKTTVSVFQRSKSEYFEKFIGVDRPLTPEEHLENLIKKRNVKTLSGLLELCKEFPASKLAKIRVEIGDAKVELHVDEITKNLATAGSEFVLVREGGEAWVKLRQSKILADRESLNTLSLLLKRKSLP
jgi:hypothetical protein